MVWLLSLYKKRLYPLDDNNLTHTIVLGVQPYISLLLCWGAGVVWLFAPSHFIINSLLFRKLMYNIQQKPEKSKKS